MGAPKDILTSRQLTVVVISSILGIDGFIMPRMVAQVAGRDGWISLILGGLWILLISGGLAYLVSQFPRQSPAVWLTQLFGNWIGRGVIVISILYYLIMCAWVLRTFGDMTRVFLLPRTPTELIIITLLFSVVYVVGHGIDPLARVTQIFFPLTLIPYILLAFMFKSKVEFAELFPILADGVVPVLKGLPPATAVFIGWGIIAYLIQFMDTPREAVKATGLGISFLWVFFLWTFVTSIASFGPVEVKYLLYPAIEFVRETGGTNTFIEKLDLFLLTFWILTIFITVAFTYYVPILASSQLIGFKDHRSMAYLVLPLVYLMSRLPKGIKATETIGIWLGYFSLAISLVVPFVVAWVLLKKRRGGLSSAK